MRKKYIFLFLVAVLSFTACEMSTPTLPDGNYELYQRPKAPENLGSENGFKDRIVLSWDSVDGATGYTVYGARMTDVGDGLKPIAVIRGNDPSYTFSANGVNVDRDQSYVFSVVAMKEFDGTEEKSTFVSDFSEKIEGAFAPEQLYMHVVATGTDLNAYWASPNLYGLYNSGHSYKNLYDATFALKYAKDGTEDWKYIDSGRYDYLSDSININGERLEQGASYKIVSEMTIKHSDGSEDMVSSPEVLVTVNSDLRPNSIDPGTISVTQGESSRGITVSWTVPAYLYDITRESMYFNIERKEAGSDGSGRWETIVDEIGTLEQDAGLSVSNEGGEYVAAFTDSNVEPNKKYAYRILNAVKASSGVIYTEEGSGTESSEAYLYSPTVESLTAAWEKIGQEDGIDRANVVFTVKEMVTAIDDLSLMIVRDTHHIMTDRHTYDYIPYPENGEYTEVNSCLEGTCGSNGYHEYAYSLVLRTSDGKDYINFGLFEFSETPNLGSLDTSNLPLFSDLSATDNRVGKIILTWTERTYDEIYQIESPYSYSYSLDNGGSWNDAVLEGEEKSITITTDKAESILLKAVSHDGAKEYISPNAVAGDVLSVSDVKASDKENGRYIFLSWDGSDIKSGISYYYEMSADPAFQDAAEKVSIDYASGKASVDMESHSDREAVYYFRLVAEYSSDEKVESASAEGTILKAVKNVKASKGSYIGQVHISWDAVEGAKSYRVYRYASNSAETEYTEVGSATSETYMIDNSPNPDTPLYAVQAVTEGGEESMFSQTEETEENILKDMEAMNYGYPFDGAKVSILGVESSVDAESYVSPTFVVYFNPTKYANEYTVYQSEKEPVFVFDMEDLTLTDEENGIYSWQSSNGIESVTYDSINNIAVANVAIGLVNIKTLTIDTVNIIGRNTTVSDNETPATEISTLANANARRALNKYEYVNIFTAGLSEIVTAANTAFGGDWYGGTGASDYDRDAYTKGSEATVKGCSSKFWQDKDYRGYITLTEYKPENVPITMTTSSNITVCHVNGDEAGYWGTDPLGTLNPDSNDGNSTAVTFRNNYTIGSSAANYRGATISVFSLSKDGTSGSYTVQINGGDSENVTLPDSYVSARVL